MAKSPKNVTIYGRLSYPTWTAQAAYESSQKSQFPAKDVASAAPSFNVIVEQAQLDKLTKHIVDEFFPYCIAQEKAGEKRDTLDAKEVALLTEQMQTEGFEGVYNIPIRPVPEKTVELAPEGVANIRVLGNKGQDIEFQAIVNDESELAIPDPNLLSFPVLKPLGATVHDIYAGCYIAVTLNLYAYHNGKLPGFSAGAGVVVFKADGDRFGGGMNIDEDEIFAD